MDKQKLIKLFQNYYLVLINFIAVIGTLVSLYFSEVESLAPCNLCWYQRIVFYPIVAISLVAHLRKDYKAYLYILPLSLIGMVLAAYHYYIQMTGGSDLGPLTCDPANPCSQIDVQFAGFITIPLMSFAGFLSISIIALLAWYFGKAKKSS